MAAVAFKVDGLDLTSYLRLQPGEGFDPVNANRFDPAFAGSTAFSDGQVWIRDAANNKEWSVPLLLTAATPDALNTLVEQINRRLSQGAQIEYQPGGATSSTFYELESGRLEPEFEHWVYQNARIRCVLKLWTQPYGSTGTYRPLATQVASGPVAFQVPSMAGDTRANMDLRVDTGSYLTASDVGVLLWSWHPHGAFTFQRAQAAFGATGVAVGASGAVGSQYWGALGGSAMATDFNWGRFTATSTTDYGRHKLYAALRHKVFPATAISVKVTDYVADRTITGSAMLASAFNASQWTLVDLGEYTVPTPVSYQGTTLAEPNVTINLTARVASGASIIATTALQVCALFSVPADLTGLLVGTGFDRRNRTRVQVAPDPRAMLDDNTRSLGAIRGAPLQISPTSRLPPQPSAGGPAMFVAQGKLSDFRGNDANDLSFKAEERWRFLR